MDQMKLYKIEAVDMNGKRRFIDNCRANNENNLFAMYADDAEDDEEIEISLTEEL